MGSHDSRLILQREYWLEGSHEAADKLARPSVRRTPSILSPRLLGGLRWRFVPLEPVGDAMHMNVYANAHVSVREQATTIISDQSSSKGSERSEPRKTDIFQAACKHKKAIFGPTPLSETSSSTVFGTSESKSSRRRCAACLIYLVSVSTNLEKEGRGGERLTVSSGARTLLC